MRRIIVVVTLALLVPACPPPPPPPPPTVPLVPCNPEECNAPRECHPIDGVDLCVHVCAPSGEVCRADEFALVTGDTTPACDCVPQRPGGRSCSGDAECVWGPDESQQSPDHLCVSVGSQAKTCQPLGISCKSTSDCSGGFVCDVARLCVKPEAPPPPPPVVWRRDADGDGRCTGESQAAPQPGPGAGWRTDCTAEERAECDDYKAFLCAPADVDVVGHITTWGTGHTPYIGLDADDGGRYSFGLITADPRLPALRHVGGAFRVRVAGRVTGTDGLGHTVMTMTGWWLLNLNADIVPEIGRLRQQGGDWFLETATERLRVIPHTAGVAARLPPLVDWKIWLSGRREGDGIRTSRFAGLYKPDVP